MKDINFNELEVGYDVPAVPGMDEKDIQTPCLILDLDALERNIKKMGDYAKAHGMRHRVHGKMHKSVDVAKLQERLGGAGVQRCADGFGIEAVKPTRRIARLDLVCGHIGFGQRCKAERGIETGPVPDWRAVGVNGTEVFCRDGFRQAC